MLDLVGKAAQGVVADLGRFVAKPGRLASDFRGVVAKELAPPRNRSAMPLRADAMVSPTRSAAWVALAEVRLPTRSNRCSSDRRRRSISPRSAEIAREYPD